MSLKITSLTKAFDEKRIFDNFSYVFPEKGIYALFGESGIGKTTLLRLIAGLDKDFKGSIDLGETSKVSFAFQEYRLFPTLTALDNVFFANFDKYNEADLGKCKKTLSNLGFTEEDMRLYPKELSGGMKQRASLARAFVNDAPILLLDEPTKELDRANRERVLEMIKHEGEGRLVIMVTHDIEDVTFCNAELIKL